MKACQLLARNLEDAWLQALNYCLLFGREYTKTGGSRSGLHRKAFDFFSVCISHPEERPLVPISKPGCIQPCTEADAEKYLREYLYTTDEPAPNESYTYAQFLTPQVHATAQHFAKQGLYNQQCVIQIGSASDVASYQLGHSLPCLRLIDCRIINEAGVDQLNYYVYFRAWNLFGAFPLNMAGIQMLKEVHCVLISEACKQEVIPGPTVAMSKDCHINDLEWDAARAWLGC